MNINFEDEKSSKTHEISFEPGYNAIIGSRGSGKSLLANILGKKHGDAKGITVENIEFFKSNVDLATSNFKFLHIGQNYFETIFNNSLEQDFASIPQVKAISENLRKTHQQQLKGNTDQIESLLNYIHNKIEEHIKMYDRVPRTDFTKKTKTGNLLSAPESSGDFENTSEFITSFKFEIEKVNKMIQRWEHCENLVNKINSDIKIQNAQEKTYKETKIKLDDLKECMDKNLTNFRSLKKEITNQAANEDLMKKLNNMLSDYRHKIDGNAAEAEQNSKYITNYFTSVYEVRLAYKIVMEKIEKLYAQFRTSEKEEIETPEYMNEKQKIIEKIKYVVTVKYKLESSTFSKLAKETIKVEIDDFIDGILFKEVKDIKFNRSFVRNISETKENFLSVCFKKLEDSIRKLDIEYVTTFETEGKDFVKDMSPGQRAQALLNIVFTKEIDDGIDYIVIDQPEDNLDNLTITEDLVQKIRRIKKDVQLFVVSHSAPVVINADADQIIVAENKEDIQYKFGEMTNESIKENIINLLDGGKYNLNVRYLKYEIDRKDTR